MRSADASSSNPNYNSIERDKFAVTGAETGEAADGGQLTDGRADSRNEMS